MEDIKYTDSLYGLIGIKSYTLHLYQRFLAGLLQEFAIDRKLDRFTADEIAEAVKSAVNMIDVLSLSTYIESQRNAK